RHLSIIEGSILRSALFAPMRSRTRAIGVLEVINKREGDFTDEDLTFFGDCARLIRLRIAPMEDRANPLGVLEDRANPLSLLDE
ncbi:MAG: GAF domain-containing protein, partial [Acidobacteriota bacterium]